MFQLLYEPRDKVLMTRFYGVYVPDDIALRDLAVSRFMAQHGLARGIMVYTDVEAIDVPMDVVVRRGHGRPLLPGQARVIVAPGAQTWEMCRVIAALQLYSRKVEPSVVRSLGEAYRVLELDNPSFELWQDSEQAGLENALALALGRIDAQKGPVGSTVGPAIDSVGDERHQMRARMLRLFEAASAGKPDKPRLPATITLSDVLNPMLANTRVADIDLKTICTSCKAPTSLGACRIVAGRTTTYVCPTCCEPLVELTPSYFARPPINTRSYSLGGFQVRLAVDLDCHGIKLPRTQAERLPPRR